MITPDMDVLVIFGRIFLILATLTATAFPVLYSFSPWYKTPLGRAIMFQAATLALVVWLKFVLTFFLEDGTRSVLLWLNVIILAMVWVITSRLTYLLWRIRKEATRKVFNNE